MAEKSDLPVFLRSLFDVAIAAAMPQGKIKPLPPRRVKGRTIVLGAGKAAASMAAALEKDWGMPVEGVVVTRYGHGTNTRHVEVVEAAHPIPDNAGLVAARRIQRLATEADADDLVIFLGSGGMSALLVLPANGITLEDKSKIGKDLLNSGASISEINSVRRALSAIKGGKLAAACYPARIVSYLISDVPGDNPAAIGSGPTVAPEGFLDPFKVLEQRNIEVPGDVLAAMKADKPPILKKKPEAHVIIRPRDMLNAVAKELAASKIRPVYLGDDVEGEARKVARTMAIMARKMAAEVSSPVVLLSGGETSVAVKGKGKGGRNLEFLLALGLELQDEKSISAIACDTDGIDGNTEHAGAILQPGTIDAIKDAGLDPEKCLDENDALEAFSAAKALVTTGPTLTNVNDFRAILVAPKNRKN